MAATRSSTSEFIQIHTWRKYASGLIEPIAEARPCPNEFYAKTGFEQVLKALVRPVALFFSFIPTNAP